MGDDQGDQRRPAAAGSGCLAALVRDGRLAAGLTQRALAARAGVPVGTIRDLEQERTLSPRPETVAGLIAALAATATATAAAAAVPGRPVGGRRRTGARQAHGAAAGRLTVRILGCPVIRRGGTDLHLESPKQLSALARLAVTPGEVVPIGELIGTLYREDMPHDPAGALRTHVWRLRLALGSWRVPGGGCGPVQWRTGGYRLVLPAQDLDVTAYREAVRRAQELTSRAPDLALDTFDAAAGLWRGRPAAGVPELDDHPALTALVDQFVHDVARFCDLAVRQHRPERAIPWLRRATALVPLHEPLQARLVDALAAAGRQSEARGLYHRVCRLLAEELGVRPGPELSRTRRALASRCFAG